MYQIELNGYSEPDHWAALNERNVYLSYTADYSPNDISHMHKSCELLLVEQGVAEYTIANVTHRIGPGDLFVIGSMDPHSRTISSYPFIRYGLTLMPGYLESLPIVNEHLGVYRTHTLEDDAKLADMSEEAFGEIRSLFLALGQERETTRRGQSEMTYALMLQLTIILSRALNSDKLDHSANTAYRAMLEIRDHIDAHYVEELSLEQLSRQFFLSPTTISRSFAACFDTSISKYISSVRIMNAVRLLENSGASVSEVAFRVGYRSINTFIRQFGQKMGVTPLQYRKQHLEHVRARQFSRTPRR
ncbi:MAG: AraC family transcriptional regulator [Arachnia sp.]